MKDVPGYEGLYAVDDAGNVYSFEWGNFRKLRPGLNSGGYYQVILCKNEKRKSHSVHRLVAQAYLEKYSEDLNVDHIDGNRQNNKLENLRMVTGQQNQWNHTKAKGYYWNKQAGKWKAQIRINGKEKYLGLFNTESEARETYLAAKKKLHVI